MAAALSIPFAVAALVLCAAGVAKLRSPDGAARALAVAGLPRGPGVVRAAAAVELVLGGWALVAPGPVVAGAVALLYGLFCGLSLVLARRQATCGCFGGFGEGDAPASAVQSALSGVLAGVAVAATLGGVHGIGWAVGDAGGVAAGVVAAAGIAAAAYATVLVYTELSRAWAAWSGR